MKNSPHDVQTKGGGGGGAKGFLTMFKKTALFLRDGFPKTTAMMIKYTVAKEAPVLIFVSSPQLVSLQIGDTLSLRTDTFEGAAYYISFCIHLVSPQ